MDTVTLLQLGVTIIVAIWGIRQTYTTNRLEREVHLLNTKLDQDIQQLHHAREAAIGMHKAHVFMLQYYYQNKQADDAHITQFAESSAHWAELRGLAFAIKDEELLRLINEPFRFEALPSEQRNMIRDEAELRGHFQQLHTRIAQLLDQAATKGKTPRR